MPVVFGVSAWAETFAALAFSFRLLLAMVFLVAVVGKVRSIDGFVKTITDIGFGDRSSRLLAHIIIAAEALTGIMLLFALVPRVAAALVAGLTLSFMWASAVALRSRAEVQCSCFGPSAVRLGAYTLARSLLLLSLGAAYLYTSSFAHTWWPSNLAEAVVVLSLTLGLVTFGRWLLNMPRLVAMTREQLGAGAGPTSNA